MALELRVIEAKDLSRAQIADALLQHSGVNETPKQSPRDVPHTYDSESAPDLQKGRGSEPFHAFTERHIWPSAAGWMAIVAELGDGKYRLERYRDFPNGATLGTFDPADYSQA